jgi:MFS transporter, PAT family, beta-lactamase induction signal transducer AmpG
MFKHSLKSVLINPRIIAMFFLGFSSGLPLVLTGSTLQAWFTEAGVNVVTIGALSLVGMPYVWKFLWAPLMDTFIPPGAGKRRGWILITQISLCIALWVLATMHPETRPTLVGIVALLIAFFSASQDIAIDAYRTDILHPEERGVGTAYFVFAYRVAMLMAGGAGLVLADHFGWRFTYQLMAGLIAFTTIATYFAPEVKAIAPAPKNLFAAVKDSFGDLFQREAIAWILLFVVLYKIGDSLALSLMSNFLLKGLGFSLTQIGVVYKTISMLGMVLGAFFGGVLLVRLDLYRALLLFGFAQAFSTLMFMLLAIVGKNYSFMVIAIFIENFCSGMSTAAFIAFLMSLCHQQYTATQYACLSALAAVGRVFLGPVAGVMVLHWGWVNFYAWAFLLSFPGLLLLVMLRNRMGFNVKAVEY